ncbi:hypothetical protein CEXT_32151 [Caerostris extrusa]|uniref:Uncharacterized protein n=1 Tax=Caerostris extrusa TaxID=172846 RepID=A0AAV4QG45_CAEEX|nr:hypothetical protein CEXT_32151 [Caerostris extrusa]
MPHSFKIPNLKSSVVVVKFQYLFNNQNEDIDVLDSYKKNIQLIKMHYMQVLDNIPPQSKKKKTAPSANTEFCAKGLTVVYACSERNISSAKTFPLLDGEIESHFSGTGNPSIANRFLN